MKLAVNPDLMFFLHNPIGKHHNMCNRSLTRTEGENCVKNLLPGSLSCDVRWLVVGCCVEEFMSWHLAWLSFH